MTKNLSQYGFDDVTMDEPAAYDKVTISYPVDLRLVAECVDATPAQVQELNPSLLRLATPKEGTFELHLPAGTKERYQTAIAAVPSEMRLWWRYHTVQPGDTLASLARSYQVTAKAIMAANHIDGSALEADAKVIIPVAPGKHPLNDTASYARRITRYKVHKGDTIETVAENFGVSPQMVRRWNGLPRGDSLRGRKVLALHLPITPTNETTSTAFKSSSHARKPTQTTAKLAAHKTGTPVDKESRDSSEQASVLRHKVKSGETLYSIATAYKTSVAALKRNNGNLATLQAGYDSGCATESVKHLSPLVFISALILLSPRIDPPLLVLESFLNPLEDLHEFVSQTPHKPVASGCVARSLGGIRSIQQ